MKKQIDTMDKYTKKIRKILDEFEEGKLNFIPCLRNIFEITEQLQKKFEIKKATLNPDSGGI